MQLESILLGYLAKCYQSLRQEVKVVQKRQMFLNWKRLVEEACILILRNVFLHFSFDLDYSKSLKKQIRSCAFQDEKAIPHLQNALCLCLM